MRIITNEIWIEAVLSQFGRPITMISKTLKGRELNLAINELLALGALKKLRNYPNDVINIYTHYQPFTFAVSGRNSNAKIKRWKNFVV